MAHQLEMVNGKAQMAYRETQGKPWHGLGTPVSDSLSPKEMMIAAGLDWNVRKADSYVSVKGKRIKTGQQALVREDTGTILTNVGKNWNPVQNEDAFNFFNEFVDSGDMIMDTAGSIKDGKNVWALASVQDSFEVFGGDQVTGYLLFSNPHTYGKSIDIKFVMERVVCNNTLTVALHEKNQQGLRLDHRTAFDASRVKEILGIGQNHMKQYKETAEYLGSKRYTDEAYQIFLGRVFGTRTNKDGKIILSRSAQNAYDITDTQPGHEYQKGSWWSAFNTCTFMNSHVIGQSAESVFDSNMFGNNSKRSVNALDLAIEMATTA